MLFKERLINIRQEREGYSLDFKVEFGNIDKAKKELSKDISAFANTSGDSSHFSIESKTHQICLAHLLRDLNFLILFTSSSFQETAD